MATTMVLPRSMSRRDRWNRSSAAPRSRSLTCPAFPWSHSQHPRRFSGTLELLETFLAPFPGRTTATSSPQSTPQMVLRSRRDRPSPPKMVVAGECPGKRSGSSFSVGRRLGSPVDSDRYENSDAQLVRALLLVQPEPEVQPLTQPQTGCGLLRCVGLHRF